MGDQIHSAPHSAPEPARRDRAAWALVRAQHGGLARADLLRLGLSARGITPGGASGRPPPVATGVSAVGRRDLGPCGRWRGAVLAWGGDPPADGDGAVLSHRSAAGLWE